MSATVFPTSEAEIAEIVSDAAARRSSLRIIGSGTRDGLGRPVMASKTLSLGKYCGITLYEPGALTLVARAGTSLEEIEQVLAGENQRLAFEPMDHLALYGSGGEPASGDPAIGKPTIGGIVGANVSGPRRIIGGACRDSLVGVRFVNGQGQAVSNGGRVMKNVTGLDLVKLMAGSFGTLGVLSEVSFKVLPANEREATLCIYGLDLKSGMKALFVALGSPFEVSGASFIPDGDGSTRTLLRIEGFEKQVDYRLTRLKDLLQSALDGPGYDIAIIEGEEHLELWRSLRDARMFRDSADLVLRLHIKPGDAPAIGDAIGREMAARMYYDWGGGLLWVGIDDPYGVATIRSVLEGYGGQATLVRAPAMVRKTVPPFHPEPLRIAAISECIRKKFDPAGILNPGRMVTPAIAASTGTASAGTASVAKGT